MHVKNNSRGKSLAIEQLFEDLTKKDLSFKCSKSCSIAIGLSSKNDKILRIKIENFVTNIRSLVVK